MQLVIGNKNYSTWSLRPWLMLDAFKVEFTEEQVSLNQEGLSTRLGQYSATRKVPVLIDDGLVVWDSLAICEYVSETYLAGKGWPEDHADRAMARAICAEMHSGFNGLRSEMPMNCRAKRTVAISNQTQHDIARIDAIWSMYAKQDHEGALRLFGQFSIADCFFAPVVLRFMTYGTQLSQPAQAYADSMRENPSMQRWLGAASTETEVIPEDEAGV